MAQRIAVFMPSWVGDAVMATPTLRALALSGTSTESLQSPSSDDSMVHAYQPQPTLIGVMQPVVAEVLAGNRWLTQQIVFSKRSWAKRVALVRQLRAARLDTIVLLTNSWWTAVVAYLAGIPQRVGYARDGRSWLLTDRLPTLRRNGQYQAVAAIDYYLQLAELLGADTRDRTMELSVSASDVRLAEQLWQQLGLLPSQATVVINSSGVWGTAKLWPADHVEQLARRIVEHHPWQVLLHCGPAERDAANAVASRLDHPRVKSMGRADQLPIGLTKAVLARAAVVVSTDSGPRHIAVALNRPVVSLFGPTDPRWTQTYNVPEIELGLNLPCRGCWEKKCPLQHNRCMRDLGMEMVYGSVVQAMHQRSCGWGIGQAA